MAALAGFDPLDPTSIAAEPGNYRDALGGAVSRLRIGIPRKPFFDDLDPEIRMAVENAIGVIRKLIAGVADVTLPEAVTSPALLGAVYAYHAELVADAGRRTLYQPLTLERILNGSKIPLPVYVEAQRQMAVLRNRTPEIFARVDLLVTPTTMRMQPTIASAASDPALDISLIRNTVPFNVLGIPAISVPCGFSRAGLPIGLQISGPRLGEGRVLALAHAYERATEWHRRSASV
jgi:aspartyl-tRNA(Asn)/glutamyl-tRNA(Gln) amidotransferase subunit A